MCAISNANGAPEIAKNATHKISKTFIDRTIIILSSPSYHANQAKLKTQQPYLAMCQKQYTTNCLARTLTQLDKQSLTLM